MYSNKNHYDRHPRRLVNTVLNEHEKPVQNGLAMTPSDMDRLAGQGIPVSQTNLESMFLDGEPDPSFELPLDLCRGVDAADLYQAAETSKKTLSKAKKKMSDVVGRYRKKALTAQKINTSESSNPVGE